MCYRNVLAKSIVFRDRNLLVYCFLSLTSPVLALFLLIDFNTVIIIITSITHIVPLLGSGLLSGACKGHTPLTLDYAGWKLARQDKL